MPKSAPPNLADLQRQMLDSIRRPLLPGYRMRPAGEETAASIIKPNDRLTASERLEIYNRQYWWRLLDSFQEDFPGVRAVVGTRSFDRLMTEYLEACPSQSWSLRNLGSRFPKFLQEHPEFSAPHTALACDVGSVEWAATVAFDDPEHPRIDPKKLASANPATLKLGIQPYVQLLELQYPVDRLLVKMKKHTSDTAAASNAVGAQKKRRAARITSRPLRETLHLAVHRVDFGVYYKRLNPLAYHLLRALRAGSTLEAACEIGIAAVTLSTEEAVAKVSQWFSTFTQLGWLCEPPGRRT